MTADQLHQPTFSIRTIVFATDFLESSRLALDYAAVFAHHYQAALVLVHVIELSQAAEEAELVGHRQSISRELAERRLEAFALGIRRLGLDVHVDLQAGEPCSAILSAAASHHADLLVLGTHGFHHGFEHLILGSNAEKILLAAPCPTLTVGRHALAGIDLEPPFKEILYVSDFSPESAEAAHYALTLGQEFSAKVELLQKLSEEDADDPARRERMAGQYCEMLSSNARVRAAGWCDPDYQLRKSLSEAAILERVRHSPNSLVVLGVHPLSRLSRHMRASFAYRLIADACCPLLTIHAPQAKSVVGPPGLEPGTNGL